MNKASPKATLWTSPATTKTTRAQPSNSPSSPTPFPPPASPPTSPKPTSSSPSTASPIRAILLPQNPLSLPYIVTPKSLVGKSPLNSFRLQGKARENSLVGTNFSTLLTFPFLQWLGSIYLSKIEEPSKQFFKPIDICS